MIEPISAATASVQTNASTPLQSHSQPFAPKPPDPVQAKHFAAHLPAKVFDPVSTQPRQLHTTTGIGSPDTNAIRERANQASKRIESHTAQYERLERELEAADQSGDSTKSLSIATKMAKEIAVGNAYTQFGVATVSASMNVFQSLLRASER
jgi:hypothetical protein